MSGRRGEQAGNTPQPHFVVIKQKNRDVSMNYEVFRDPLIAPVRTTVYNAPNPLGGVAGAVPSHQQAIKSGYERDHWNQA